MPTASEIERDVRGMERLFFFLPAFGGFLFRRTRATLLLG